jgi:hypothetical protein
VDPHGGAPTLCAIRQHASLDGVGVARLAVDLGEHPVVALVDADGGELGGLVARHPSSTVMVLVVECDGTAYGLGLRRVWWTSLRRVPDMAVSQ